MLVLSRLRGERIIIGEGDDQVIITAVDIRGDKVRLGITAKNSTPIHREEVYKIIQEHKTKGQAE